MRIASIGLGLGQWPLVRKRATHVIWDSNNVCVQGFCSGLLSFVAQIYNMRNAICAMQIPACATQIFAHICATKQSRTMQNSLVRTSELFLRYDVGPARAFLGEAKKTPWHIVWFGPWDTGFNNRKMGQVCTASYQGAGNRNDQLCSMMTALQFSDPAIACRQ